MNGDAEASFELDSEALSSGLDEVAGKFEAIAGSINASFGAANAQLGRTAVSAQMVGASAVPANGFSVALLNAAHAGRLVAVSLGAIVMMATRAAPLVQYLPNSLGAWVPKLKAVVEQHGALVAKISLVHKTAQVLTGRLSTLSAAFSVLEMRQLGVTRGWALFGAAGGLAISRVVAGARAATAAVGGLGRGLARATSGGVTGAFAGMGRSLSTIAMVASPIAGMALALGPVGAAALGVAGAFGAIKKSVAAAAEVQTLETSFITLLGSADKAHARIAELSKFAATTPFSIPGVVKSSKVLETLTKGALSTGAGLRLVGDAAAMSGEPMEALSVHIGRLYDGLTNGRPVGESLARLQELGLVSSDTRGKIETLQKSGAKGAAVWAVAAADLGRFSGEMKRQSGTWEGMMSNMSDNVGGLFRAFGAPVITALTPYLAKLIDWVASLTAWAEKAGSIFSGWSALLAHIFTEGQMTEALKLAGTVAMVEVARVLLGGLTGAGAALGAILGGVAVSFVTILAAMTKPEFWKGLGNALLSAAAALGAMLLEGAAKLLDALADVPGLGDTATRAAGFARRDASALTETAMSAGSAAGANLAPLMGELRDGLGNAFKSAGAAFTEGNAQGQSLIDPSGAHANLTKFIQPLAAGAQKTLDDAAAAAKRGGLPAPLGPQGPVEPSAGGAGKSASDVASIQKVGGGGGFSISQADPVLAENKNQTVELKNIRAELRAINEKYGTRRPEVGSPVFA